MTEYTGHKAVELETHLAEVSIPRTLITLDIVKNEDGDKVLFIGYGMEGDGETQRCIVLSTDETQRLKEALNDALNETPAVRIKSTAF